jgi:predicted DCC family thiol-disulfide oxidoreductase YuxK
MIYDGTCPMCRRQARVVARFDWLHQLEMLPYDDVVLAWPEIARERIGDGVRLRTRRGNVTVGFDAVLSIMRRTPLGVIPSLLLAIPPFRQLGRRWYQRVAARRVVDPCSNDTCGVRIEPGAARTLAADSIGTKR